MRCSAGRLRAHDTPEASSRPDGHLHPSQTELLASVGDGGRGGCSPGARPGQASQTLGIRPVAREKREAATAYPTLWDRNPSKPPISSSSASRACSILSQPVRFPKRATSWPTSPRPAARSRTVPAGRRRPRGRRADRLAGVPFGQFADDVGNALRSSRCVGERVPAGGHGRAYARSLLTRRL